MKITKWSGKTRGRTRIRHGFKNPTVPIDDPAAVGIETPGYGSGLGVVDGEVAVAVIVSSACFVAEEGGWLAGQEIGMGGGDEGGEGDGGCEGEKGEEEKG